MLLHHYLQQMADLHKRSEAEYEAVLSEITDPAMKAKVEAWRPGDLIADEYPQGDEKKEEPPKPEESDGKAADQGKQAGGIGFTSGGTDSFADKLGAETTGQKEADAAAQTNHQPEGQPQQEPAGGTAPA